MLCKEITVFHNERCKRTVNSLRGQNADLLLLQQVIDLHAYALRN
jgi:hypothetical protein